MPVIPTNLVISFIMSRRPYTRFTLCTLEILSWDDKPNDITPIENPVKLPLHFFLPSLIHLHPQPLGRMKAGRLVQSARIVCDCHNLIAGVARGKVGGRNLCQGAIRCVYRLSRSR